jgi:hypothetical protein
MNLTTIIRDVKEGNDIVCQHLINPSATAMLPPQCCGVNGVNGVNGADKKNILPVRERLALQAHLL